MKKINKIKVKLNNIELICASIFLLVKMIFNKYEFAFLTMSILTIIIVILLIIFFRQHTYGQEKPLLTALSIYYKTMAYSAVLFSTYSYPIRVTCLGILMLSVILYVVLSYVYGKKYNEMLNAYLYLCLASYGYAWYI